jgi:hypothetical protein
VRRGWSPHPLAERPRRSDVPTEVTKDGRTWRIGTAAEVAWIATATVVGKTITSAIPPVFEAYATFHELGWEQSFVEAGPEQALTWRIGHMRSPQFGMVPDLFFPADRSWLVSALWDDTWTCVGGTNELIDRLRLDPRVQARPVQLGEDATPPGHEPL